MRIKEILTQLIISKCKKGKIAAQLTIAKSSDDFNTEALELLGCVFLFYAGTYTIKAILTGLGLEAYRRVGSLVFYCLWAFHLLKLVLKNTGILKRILVFEGIYCLILICNLALAPKTAQYYWEYYTFIRQILVVFLPCGAVLSKVTNFDNGFSYMVKYAWIGMILMIISLPLGYISTIGEQYWGVHLTPFAIIFWCSYFRSKKAHRTVNGYRRLNPGIIWRSTIPGYSCSRIFCDIYIRSPRKQKNDAALLRCYCPYRYYIYYRCL